MSRKGLVARIAMNMQTLREDLELFERHYVSTDPYPIVGCMVTQEKYDQVAAAAFSAQDMFMSLPLPDCDEMSFGTVDMEMVKECEREAAKNNRLRACADTDDWSTLEDTHLYKKPKLDDGPILRTLATPPTPTLPPSLIDNPFPPFA